ncbi:hypothetical protein E2542_SST01736 [Spatholobus suberectus]|nr:hypothetical protein E2542_SST01736 [Spatholobus suberectus]
MMLYTYKSTFFSGGGMPIEVLISMRKESCCYYFQVSACILTALQSLKLLHSFVGVLILAPDLLQFTDISFSNMVGFWAKVDRITNSRTASTNMFQVQLQNK